MEFEQRIQQACALLSAGDLVAFPTETVYGLGADASHPLGLQKIFAAKQRPIDHPLIVHLADITQLTAWASHISEDALKLAEAFWPGPLTLILKKSSHVSDMVTGGQDTVGIRIPAHPVAQQLLTAFGKGIAAPSANRFGRISPTTASAVREELGEAVTCILEGGQCEVGIESTIVDVSGDDVIILRPGMISARQIENVLQQPLTTIKKNAPRVSGSCESHYAPTTLTRLLPTEELKKYLLSSNDANHPVALVMFETSFTDINANPFIQKIMMSTDPKKYAHDLYQVLRDLDKQCFKEILIETLPLTDEWDAIRDRIKRATIKI